ncbi:1-phosphatidylinositol-4,5-bisphosphate phosphodiesterase beta-2 [Gossypium australe]|uniref:1-phosphatidylinositol-4,5-bisphosphate phosphodiesterase beta-2 n=1 Tax=Gossypium australe TaxID=47621 RepID=A0A5B6WIJ4_9ROSI|nr:1-phosphatidylinositol-4,5-bisphosphate phosphodiesterase beta-2 [Gossypium australe]
MVEYCEIPSVRGFGDAEDSVVAIHRSTFHFREYIVLLEVWHTESPAPNLTRGYGRGTRGRGRGRGARVGSSASGHMLEGEPPTSPVTETRSHDRIGGDDALSQAMWRVLERVAGASTGSVARGSISERLWSNEAEVFRGISGIAPNVAEYWLEAVERIMDDLDCTCPYCETRHTSVRESTQADRYVGASYVDARRKEFLNLVQGNKSLAEYKTEFLRLSRYARGIVTTDYERCVRFKNGLRVLIAPQRERDFAALVEKAKIAEEVKHSERQNRDKG